MTSNFEKAHIVDFAEEALLQLNVELDNVQIDQFTTPLLELITTTETWNIANYEKAERLIRLLIPFRNLDIHYFDPKKQ